MAAAVTVRTPSSSSSSTPASAPSVPWSTCEVSTVAGDPSRDSSTITCIDALGSDASFIRPSALAWDQHGLLYVTDQDDHRIRRLSPYGT
jgi:hypothetical protein